MPYPGDVLLPVNAKFFGFVDPKFEFDSNWDVVWSFQYSLSGTQHGFTTFLTTTPTLTTGIPGQYMGILGSIPYILDQNGEPLTDETGDFLYYNSPSSFNQNSNAILSIAFDSTGFYALSNYTNNGVSLNEVKSESLVIRDSNSDVIFNERLSALDSTFTLTTSGDTFRTLRFRYQGTGRRISIDWKSEGTKYRNLTTVEIRNTRERINTKVYPGFTFCSPISSSTLSSSTLRLRNFHVQGNIGEPEYEYSNFIPLTSSKPTEFTTISALS